MRGVCVAGVAGVMGVAALTPAAVAGISNDVPAGYVNVEDVFESRIRLDGGNSQTWKTAIWDDTTLLATGGNVQNVFANGETYDFTMTYDAVAGQATIDVAGLSVTTAVSLTPGFDLIGFRFFVRSESTGSTVVENLSVGSDVFATESVPSISSGLGEVFVEADAYYFDAPVSSLTMTGQITFGWDAGTNLQGERFKFSFKPLEGQFIPTPGAAGALALLGVAALRRRR